MLELDEKYKLEYTETANLRRHYSIMRSSLTTLCMTASLAAFAGYISQTSRPLFLAFIGFFMLIGASIAWLVFSYRYQKATLYLAELWGWFEGAVQVAPARFDEFGAGFHEVVTQMLRDKMSWVMFGALVAIGGAFFKFA